MNSSSTWSAELTGWAACQGGFMGDMTESVFEKFPHGKAALKKLGKVSANFRLYSGEWLGEKPADWVVMKLCGAQFRAAKTGKNKGQLSIMMPGTKRTVYVTSEEIKACE